MSYILGQANVSSSSKDEEKGKESEKKDNEADEKGRFICWLMNMKPYLSIQCTDLYFNISVL